MNLHSIVAPLIGAINPNTTGSLITAAGYTTGADGSQSSNYTTTTGITMQVQALSASDLKQIGSISVQTVMRAIYLNGNIEGIDRKQISGGDLIVLPFATFKVTQVLETWDNSGWCKVAATQQMD